MGSIVDVNILAIKEIMNMYNIKNQKECLEKVLYMFRHSIEQWNMEIKNK